MSLLSSRDPTVTTAVPQSPEVDDPEIVSPVNTPSLNQWLPASNLKPGEHLKTPDGTVAVADGGTTPKVHDGWMWDLTVPGNNDHDFYVLPADVPPPTRSGTAAVPVLVHNTNCPFSAPRILAVDGWGETTVLPVHEIDSSLYPDVADNFTNAVRNGRSPIVTRMIGRARIKANRYAAQAGQPRPGMLGTDAQGQELSWDEFPYASTYEGGTGAQLRPINNMQNVAHGRDSLLPFLTDNGIGDGDQYYVRVK